MPQLTVFPEGTVTNGRALLTFKKGAFKDLKPVKIYVTKFDDAHDYFIPWNDILEPFCVWGMVI